MSVRTPLTILWNMKQLFLVLCVALASSAVQAQKVYKIIQPDGTVEYTDAPPPDSPAQQIEVPPLNTSEPLAPPSGSATQSANAADGKPENTPPDHSNAGGNGDPGGDDESESEGDE